MAKPTAILIFLISLFLIPQLCFAGIDFDGSDDYIDCGDPVNPSGDFSISVWVYFTDLQAETEQIIGNGDNDDDDSGWMVYWYNNELRFQVCHDGAGYKSAFKAWTTTNQWVHIAEVFDEGSSIKLYINGVEGTPRTTNIGNYVDSIDNLVMGVNAGGDNLRPFEGQINEVAIWNTILSTTDIEILYKSKIKGMPLQIKPDSLVAYWPMNDGRDGTHLGDGFVIKDRKGTNDGTTDDGTNGTGCIGKGEEVLSYP